VEQGHPRQGLAVLRSMYAATTRAVRCGQHTSDWFDIDLGTAQGDTLSCILFDTFVDDLLREVEAASQGVLLPVRPAGASCQQARGQQAAGEADQGPPADDASAALVAALKALMFADHWSGRDRGGIAMHHQHLLFVVHQVEDGGQHRAH
jgi:hypothetical protein